MYWPLRLLQCPQSDCEYSCLDGKGIWQLGVKILQKSYHTTLSHSHKIFMGGKKPRKVVASAQVRDSRELNRRNVYMAFLGGGTFQSDLEIEGLCGLILGQAQRLLGFFFCWACGCWEWQFQPLEKYGGRVWLLELHRGRESHSAIW